MVARWLIGVNNPIAFWHEPERDSGGCLDSFILARFGLRPISGRIVSAAQVGLFALVFAGPDGLKQFRSHKRRLC